jgi:hypothetical protein
MPILLIGGVLRLRRRSLASGREDLAISSALPPPVRLLADVGPWVIIGTLLAWLAALLSGLGSGITLIALQFLTIAAILGAISMTAYAGTTLRASGSLGRSIEASVVALAGLTTAWLFLAFGLVDL